VAYRRREPGPLHARMRVDRLLPDLARAWLRGTGIASEFMAPIMAFLHSGLGAPLPDVQFLIVAAPMTAGPYLAPFVPPYPDGFAIRVAVLRPESRGNLSLASADPRTPPLIVQNFLAAERDRLTLRAGLRLAREVGRQAPLRPFAAEETAPGPQNWSDAALDAHIAATGISVHHPLGTCRMGRDPEEGAVVDGELRVHGVERLRVVDASVMPDLVGGNINAPVIMIAEKAADLIRGRPPLAPVNV
jgi:4-pyridoxate dehydrogenase